MKPRSLAKTCDSSVSRYQSGRRPIASTPTRQISPRRARKAAGPWANGPNAARARVNASWAWGSMRRTSLTMGGKTSSIASIGSSPRSKTMPRSVASTSCESLPPRESVMPSAVDSSRRRAMVLISPLCANAGNGCTRSKLVVVFVAYRLCPNAIDVLKRGSARSVKYALSCCGRPPDVDAGVVEAASRAPRRSLDLERELPEAGLTLPRARAERGAARVAMALEEHADAVLREDAPGLRLDELVVARRDEDVRHGEAPVEREARVEPRRAERVGPELAREVGQDAGAVALAVDRTGAGREALQPADRLRQDLAGRRPLLAPDRDQGTGVALVVHGGTLS